MLKLLSIIILSLFINVAYVDELNSRLQLNREYKYIPLNIQYNYVTNKYMNTSIKPVNSITTTKKLININTISKIESSNNRFALSPDKTCKGLCQLTEAAWNEASMSLYGKVKYSYYIYWSNAKINKQIADEYYNDVLPDYLEAYKVPVNTSTLIASYNYGPNRVKYLIRRYGKSWEKHLPLETKSYLKKYKNLN